MKAATTWGGCAKTKRVLWARWLCRTASLQRQSRDQRTPADSLMKGQVQGLGAGPRTWREGGLCGGGQKCSQPVPTHVEGVQGTTPYLPSRLLPSLLLAKPKGGQHAEQDEERTWSGSGKAPLEPGCPPDSPFPAHHSNPVGLSLRMAGVLLTSPLAGSENNPMPAERPPLLARGEEAASAAPEGHPVPADSCGTAAAGAQGPDRAASGGCTPQAGDLSPATRLLCGTVQEPRQYASTQSGEGLGEV